MASFPGRIVGALISAAGAAVLAAATLAGAAPTDRCEFAEADSRWVQRALDGWELVRRDHLKLDARPLPWIVLYNAACSWDLAPTEPPLQPNSRLLFTTFTFAGAPLQVRGTPHRGTVLLPNRVEIPIEIKASTMLYHSGRETFLVMSMPSVWRTDRRQATKKSLDEYLQGVFSHELTHTRQLVTINRRLRTLLRSANMPDRLNDDAIQVRFAKEPGFARSFDQERELFYQAAGARDAATRRTLVEKALARKQHRHARYFSGGNAVYAEIEGLFLTMEGAAQWAAYSLLRSRGQVGKGQAEAVDLVRDDRKYWSQDQGLALFLLLDAMVPDWQSKMFVPVPPSPFTLLEEAIGGTTGAAQP